MELTRVAICGPAVGVARARPEAVTSDAGEGRARGTRATVRRADGARPGAIAPRERAPETDRRPKAGGIGAGAFRRDRARGADRATRGVLRRVGRLIVDRANVRAAVHRDFGAAGRR